MSQNKVKMTLFDGGKITGGTNITGINMTGVKGKSSQPKGQTSGGQDVEITGMSNTTIEQATVGNFNVVGIDHTNSPVRDAPKGDTQKASF